MGLITYHELFSDPKIPDDAKQRAKTILEGCHGQSVGSYSDSAGIAVIRQHVAEYIERRDGGIPSDWQNIILSAGASGGIKAILALLRCSINDKRPGVMVPIPQYPLYSATIAEFDMEQVGYYLDESKNWGLDIVELQRALDESKKVCAPRAIVVINPGNPTGQVLTKENIQERLSSLLTRKSCSSLLMKSIRTMFMRQALHSTHSKRLSQRWVNLTIKWSWLVLCHAQNVIWASVESVAATLNYSTYVLMLKLCYSSLSLLNCAQLLSDRPVWIQW